MPHTASPTDFTLATIDDFLAGDSREIAFQVVDANGNGVPISNATVEWRLFARDYQTGDSDATLTGDDSNVEIVTDNRADTSVGEFEVRLDPAATEDLYGKFYQRPKVIQSNGDEATWRGELIISA